MPKFLLRIVTWLLVPALALGNIPRAEGRLTAAAMPKPLPAGFPTQTLGLPVESMHIASNASTFSLLQKAAQFHQASWQDVRTLAKMADEESPGHMNRVGLYTAILARALGMSREEADELRYASELHDTGKFGVPDHILRKPGPLTEEEKKKMELHTWVGAETLYNNRLWSRIVRRASRIADEHQEWWDGTGYPRGISGDKISRDARIVAVADTFDALTQKRVYHEPLAFEEALKRLRAQAGNHFDPRVIRLLDNPETLRRMKWVYDTSPAGLARHAPRMRPSRVRKYLLPASAAILLAVRIGIALHGTGHAASSPGVAHAGLGDFTGLLAAYAFVGNILSRLRGAETAEASPTPAAKISRRSFIFDTALRAVAVTLAGGIGVALWKSPRFRQISPSSAQPSEDVVPLDIVFAPGIAHANQVRVRRAIDLLVRLYPRLTEYWGPDQPNGILPLHIGLESPEKLIEEDGFGIGPLDEEIKTTRAIAHVLAALELKPKGHEAFNDPSARKFLQISRAQVARWLAKAEQMKKSKTNTAGPVTEEIRARLGHSYDPQGVEGLVLVGRHSRFYADDGQLHYLPAILLDPAVFEGDNEHLILARTVVALAHELMGRLIYQRGNYVPESFPDQPMIGKLPDWGVRSTRHRPAPSKHPGSSLAGIVSAGVIGLGSGPTDAKFHADRVSAARAAMSHSTNSSDIIRALLASSNSDALLSEIPLGSRFLGYSADAVEFKSSDDEVIRIGRIVPRLNTPELLQARRTRVLSNWQIEWLPYADSTHVTFSHTDRLAASIRIRGDVVIRPDRTQVAVGVLADDTPVIIDPNGIQSVPQIQAEQLPTDLKLATKGLQSFNELLSKLAIFLPTETIEMIAQDRNFLACYMGTAPTTSLALHQARPYGLMAAEIERIRKLIEQDPNFLITPRRKYSRPRPDDGYSLVNLAAVKNVLSIYGDSYFSADAQTNTIHWLQTFLILPKQSENGIVAECLLRGWPLHAALEFSALPPLVQTVKLTHQTITPAERNYWAGQISSMNDVKLSKEEVTAVREFLISRKILQNGRVPQLEFAYPIASPYANDIIGFGTRDREWVQALEAIAKEALKNSKALEGRKDKSAAPGAMWLKTVSAEAIADAKKLDVEITRKVMDFIIALVTFDNGHVILNPRERLGINRLIDGRLSLDEALDLMGLTADTAPETRTTNNGQSANFVFVRSKIVDRSLWEEMLAREHHISPLGLIIHTTEHTANMTYVLIPEEPWDMLTLDDQADIQEHEILEVNLGSHAAAVAAQGREKFNRLVISARATLISPKVSIPHPEKYVMAGEEAPPASAPIHPSLAHLQKIFDEEKEEHDAAYADIIDVPTDPGLNSGSPEFIHMFPREVIVQVAKTQFSKAALSFWNALAADAPAKKKFSLGMAMYKAGKLLNIDDAILDAIIAAIDSSGPREVVNPWDAIPALDAFYDILHAAEALTSPQRLLATDRQAYPADDPEWRQLRAAA